MALFPWLLGCPGSETSRGPTFSDVTASSGIEFRFVNGAGDARHLVETMIGGLGWIDYDGDGDGDLYLVNGHSDSLRADEPGRERNRLYRNDGGGRFTDVTEESGTGDRRYGCGVAVGDYDNDGDSDMLVTNFGRNTLFHNQGDGTFADVTEAAGLTETGFNMSAAWVDLDRDGGLDLYVVRYLKYHPRTSKSCEENGVSVYCHPRFFPGEADLLYRNRGDGTFEEMGARAGIDRAGPTEGKGLGVVAFDYDRDGWTDIYVANDLTPNFLWRNNGDFTFTDVGQSTGTALSASGRPQAGMGVDIADTDGDGRIDIHVTNFSGELNALYLGDTAGSFSESSSRCGLGLTFTALGFGTLFVDCDLDGDQDIVTANGHINDRVEVTDPGTGTAYRQRPHLLLNDGAGSFTDAAAEGGRSFSETVVGRGLTSCDFDRDGDVDIAMMTLDRSLVLLRNENRRGRGGVTVRLRGTASPRDGYGARVEATVGAATQVFEYQSARSYLSACDPALVIGIGGAPRIDRLRIFWPSGKVQDLIDIPSGSVKLVEEPR